MTFVWGQLGRKQVQESQRTPTSESTQGTVEGKLADGIVRGQRTCSKKNEVQMPQKEAGAEMQIKKKGDPGHSIAIQSREEQAKEGLGHPGRSLLWFPPRADKNLPDVQFLTQILSHK